MTEKTPYEILEEENWELEEQVESLKREIKTLERQIQTAQHWIALEKNQRVKHFSALAPCDDIWIIWKKDKENIDKITIRKDNWEFKDISTEDLYQI